MRLLFRDKEYRLCMNCARAVSASEDEMLCMKKGIVSKGSCCAAFRYDPLKREPSTAKAPDFDAFRDVDFSL